MEPCPCCSQPKKSCGCQVQWLAAANGDLYEWCATHRRTLERQLIPQDEFEEQIDETIGE